MLKITVCFPRRRSRPAGSALLLAPLIALLLTGRPAAAQQPPPASAASPAPAATGRITGVVLDSATRAPVPYATVLLLPVLRAPADQPADQPGGAPAKPLTGVAAGVDGQFTIERVAPGTYRVRVLTMDDREIGRKTFTFIEGEAPVTETEID